MKIENVEVSGWAAAIRGMRNPMNSWNLSDTDLNQESSDFKFGEKDSVLASASAASLA